MAFLLAISTSLSAQTQFSVGTDLVSSYIWRGMYQSGAAIQPKLAFSVGDFSLAGWGSVDFNGQNKKEVDITATYLLGGFTISVSDYWWAGETIGNGRPNGQNKYFNFNNHTTDHTIEAGLAYTFFLNKNTFTLFWNTMLWGNDIKNNGQQAYSSYVELQYAFNLKNIALNAGIGASPYESGQYLIKNFAVTNIFLRGTKTFRITDSFSLPIFTQLIWNPNREDVHFIFGITL